MAIFLFLRWIAGLLSLAVLAGAAWLLWSWWPRNYVDLNGAAHQVRGADWRLWTGLGLLAFSVLGRFLVLALFKDRPAEPRVKRDEGHRVTGPNGTALWVESYGARTLPTIVFTHGWGLDSSVWSHAKAAFDGRYRLVMWDLPGLGAQQGSARRQILDRGFAADLRAVVEDSGAEKVLLIGHSIGGMTTQTLVRDHPEFARERVAGIALVDTSYRNPIDTLVLSGLWRVLRFPLIEPLCWVQIALSPIVHLMNWKSYLDGTAHLVARLGFGKIVPRGALDHVARLAAYNAPGVQAKGDLAMFRWSVEPALPTFNTPTLVLGGTSDIVTLPAQAST